MTLIHIYKVFDDVIDGRLFYYFIALSFYLKELNLTLLN